MKKLSFRRRPAEAGPAYPSFAGSPSERRALLAALGAAVALSSCMGAATTPEMESAPDAGTDAGLEVTGGAPVQPDAGTPEDPDAGEPDAGEATAGAPALPDGGEK
jgi:hypothetical protein